MSETEALEDIRDRVQEVIDDGDPGIDPAQMLKLLDHHIAQVKSSRPDQFALDIALANHNFGLEVQRHLHASTITVGQGTLRASMILNGGASVAMLAFAGVLAEHQPAALTTIASALMMFALATLLAVISFGTTYVSTYCNSEGYTGHKNWIFAAYIFTYSGILMIILSYGLFLFGAISVTKAFEAVAAG